MSTVIVIGSGSYFAAIVEYGLPHLQSRVSCRIHSRAGLIFSFELTIRAAKQRGKEAEMMSLKREDSVVPHFHVFNARPGEARACDFSIFCKGHAFQTLVTSLVSPPRPHSLHC